MHEKRPAIGCFATDTHVTARMANRSFWRQQHTFRDSAGGDEIDFAEDFTNCYALDGEFASALLLA